MKIKKFTNYLLVIILTIALIIPNCNVSAAFYSKILSATEAGNVLDIVLLNEGQTAYSKGYYLFYNSNYAAAYNKEFPYLNSNYPYYSIVDNGVSYSITGSAGCMAYSNFVCKYVFGTNSTSANRKYICSSAGNMTADNVKSVITEHAQLGEHIRIDYTHSISFIAYDSNGFYYTDYETDNNPIIRLRYTTWAQFKNECNAKAKTAWIYNTNTVTNSVNNSGTVTLTSTPDKNTITDNNAIVYYNINKPSSYGITKIGIRVRKDGSTYENGWSYYQSPTYGNYSGKTDVEVCWDFQNELGFTPIHATKYYLQFYAKVNGTEYYSVEYYITTTGSHSYTLEYEAAHPHRYYNVCACGYYYYTGENAPEGVVNSCSTCYPVGKPTVYLEKDSYALGETITANWTTAERATHYNVWIDQKEVDGSYTKLAYRQDGITTNSFSISELPIGEYRFRIYAYDSTRKDSSGDWSHTEANLVYFTVYANADFHDWTFDFDATMNAMSDFALSNTTAATAMKEFSKGLIGSTQLYNEESFEMPEVPNRPGYRFTSWKQLLSPGESYGAVTYSIYKFQAQYEPLLYSKGECMYCDVNFDEKLDLKDLVRIKKMLAGLSDTHVSADLNGDENINALDATILSSNVCESLFGNK